MVIGLLDYGYLGISSKMAKNVDLRKRHRLERQFHDNLAKNEILKNYNYKLFFQAPTAIENRYALALLRPLKNKKILDLGCGSGEASLFFASKGAYVHAIDISSKMIANLKNLSYEYNLGDRIKTYIMVAERLKFPQESFDYIYGNGLLHHADVALVLKAVYRVLKKNGIAIFIDPLEHNFLINIYRYLAKNVRTSTERPLDYSRIKDMTEFGFREVEHKEFQLLTLLIFVWMYIFEKIDPNKERYWKKIILESKKYQRVFMILSKLDSWCFKLFPTLRKYYWNTVITLKK